jgi:hypothetical protein
MKLKVNLISGGRYYKAGEDIPEDALPGFASKYAVTVSEDGDAVDESYAESLQRQKADLDDHHAAKPKAIKASPKMKGKAFVKRDDRFVLAAKVENLIPGETLYWHRPRSFGISEQFIAYSRVRSEADSL